MRANEKKARILIIEDEVLISADLESRLKSFGYEICGNATTAEKALETLERTQLDLVLIDIVLKGEMDGIKAAEIIREHWGIPVVFLTAYADADRLERAKLTTPFGYILKPFQNRDLKVTIEMALYAAEVDAQRKKAEKDNAFQAKLLASVGQSVIATDDKGLITYWNKAAEKMYGWSSDEAVGRNIIEVIPKDQSKTEADNVMKTLLSGDSWEGAFEAEHRDGSCFPVFEIDTPIINDKGGLTGIIGVSTDIRTRKEAEEALKRSEERLRQIVENMPVMMDALDEEANIIAWNRECERVTGYPAHEVVGNPRALEMLYPDADYRERMITELTELGFDFRDQEYALTCKDESKKTISWSNISKNQPIPGWFTWAIGVDVTKRVQAEKALRQSEAALNDAQAIAHIGSWSWDVERDAVYWSDELYRILGVEPQSIESTLQTYLRFVHPDDVTAIQHAAASSLRNVGRTFQVEHRIIRPDGSLRFATSRGEVIKWTKDGNPSFVIGTTQDVTENKLAEEALRESNERYKGIFNNTFNGVAVYKAVDSGDDFVFVDFNAHGAAIEKTSREEVIGKRVTELFPGVKDFGLFDVFRRVWETGVSEHYPVAQYKDDRITGWRENFVYRLPSGEIVAVYSDETERKRAEEEKRKLESRLQQSHKMEAIGTLAGGIAHDFNNILGAITGYTQLTLFDIDQSDPNYGNLQQVLKASQRAKDLVKQILTFSRQVEKQISPVEVTPIIKECLKFLRSSLPSTIDIKQDIQERAGMILADPTQIHQVIMNLCTNAAHAMRMDGGVLDVKLQESDAESSSYISGLKPCKYLRLTVSDDGHGMDETILRKIFEPYFTTKSREEGTGLGLAVVHGIVQDHGGVIRVDSAPGAGTTFDVYFPVISESSYAPIDENADVPTGNEKILLIDDEAALLEMGRLLLERLGYSVDTEISSGKALEKIRSSPNVYDLIITDQTMPEMTGIRLAEKIRTIRPDLPVILCTGFSSSVTARDAKEAGVKDFLMKPIVLPDLAASVRKALDATC